MAPAVSSLSCSIPAQRFPDEIWLLIMEAVVPYASQQILPPSHPSACTLLNLALVCKMLYPEAMRLIHRHCAYVDCRQRAKLFAEHLRATKSLHPAGRRWEHITQLYLRPFRYLPEMNDSVYEEHDGSNAILDRTTAEDVAYIFKTLAPHLKRLVIDIPLRALYPEDDLEGVRPLLHRAFKQLVELEEFTSLNDELYLATARRSRWGDYLRPGVDEDEDDDEYQDSDSDSDSEHDDETQTARLVRYIPEDMPQENIWMCWPKLRYLSLYNLSLYEDQDVWHCLKSHRELEKLVLVRAESSIIEDETNIKLAWTNARPAEPQGLRSKQLSMVWVNSVEEQPKFSSFSAEWPLLDPEEEVLVFVADTPNTEDNIVSNKDISRQLSLEGRLFDDEATGAIDTRLMRLDDEQRLVRSKELFGHYL